MTLQNINGCLQFCFVLIFLQKIFIKQGQFFELHKHVNFKVKWKVIKQKTTVLQNNVVKISKNDGMS